MSSATRANLEPDPHGLQSAYQSRCERAYTHARNDDHPPRPACAARSSSPRAKPDLTSADVLKVAERFEAWVTRDGELVGSRCGICPSQRRFLCQDYAAELDRSPAPSLTMDFQDTRSSGGSMQSEAMVDILAEAAAACAAARLGGGGAAAQRRGRRAAQRPTLAVIAIGLALTEPQLTPRTRIRLRQAETALLAAARRVRQFILADAVALR